MQSLQEKLKVRIEFDIYAHKSMCPIKIKIAGTKLDVDTFFCFIERKLAAK